MERPITIAIAFVILLFLLLIVFARRGSTETANTIKSTLPGLWNASPTFCTDSSIDGMMVYIGPDLEDGHCLSNHKAYIIMHANNAIILQKTINMRITHQNSWLADIAPGSRSVHRLNVEFEESPDDEDDNISISSIMPISQVMELDLSNGKMTWTGLDPSSDSERRYAELYRDNINSLPTPS
jgi:hypothetical protein